MKIEIKSRFTGSVVISGEYESIKDCLQKNRGAYLIGAYLRGADLEGAIKIPIYCKWSHGVTDGFIHIGCEKRSVDDWKKFLDSDEVIETKRDTQEFKQIKAVICAYIAYLETLND